MIKDKLRDATFKYIESEVFHIQETLRMIDQIKYEIIHGKNIDIDSPQPGRNSVRNISDETERKATELYEHERLRNMERNSNAVLKVYDGLIEEKKELIRIYYWNRPGELTWDGIAKELNVGRRTAIRWRKSFIYEIAKELGER